jgi:WD40 repeat protein
MFAATADGVIRQIDRDSRILYKHHDPYRIDINENCTRLASGAYDGSLIVYDLVKDKIAYDLHHANSKQITNVVFQGDELVTSSLDATVKRWHVGTRMELMSSTQLSGPVDKMRVFSDGWAASVSDHILVMNFARSGSRIQLSLNRPIADIAISPNERYIAAADTDEIIVIDRILDTIATIHSNTSSFTCLQFINSAEIATCDTAMILTLSISLLQFSPMYSNTKDDL